MKSSHPLYDDDLAYIHDEGFTALAEGAAPEILRLLSTQRSSGVVVELGCGSGVLARRLYDAGYEVMGIDISPAMIELARQRAPAAQLHVGSIWQSPLPACRAVIALGEVVCYRTEDGRSDLRSLARRVFRALQPGGLWIFDVAETGLDRHRKQGFSQGDDWACLVQFEYDTGHDRLTRHITTFRRTGTLFRRSNCRHVVQLYHAGQLAQWLRAEGFQVRVVRKFGSHPLLPKRVGFVARKP